MGSSRALNIHATWTQVLDVLDIPVPHETLPIQVCCPLCPGKRLVVYEDNISGGCWHYCFDCQHSGDMIELAAAVWGIGLRTAVRKLAALGVPIDCDDEKVEKYVSGYPSLRQRMTSMWDRAREYLLKVRSTDLNVMTHRLKLHHNLEAKRWSNGPCRLYGALSIKDVERTFTPGSVNKAGFASRLTCTFKGPGWTEVLLTPYYDLPERICGFAFIGRGCRNQDRVFRIPRLHMEKITEAGLALFWTVEAGKACLGEYLIAVDDPWFAIRIQLRHYAGSTLPLPLVAWYDDGKRRTQAAWGNLPSRRAVFWVRDEVISPEVLNQAIVTDGMISMGVQLDFSTKRQDHYIRNNEPRDIARKVIKRALPWREAVKEWAERSQDGPVEELMLGLERYGHDQKTLADLSERLARFARLPKPKPGVPIGVNFRVVETNGEWWCHGPNGNSMVMNASLRIDGYITKPVNKHGDVVHYKGRLIHQGEEIPFEIPVATMAHYGPRRLEMLLARHKGATLYIASGWRERLVKVAQAMSRMEAR